MRHFRDLKIGTKFNVIMVLFMIALFFFAGAYNYRRQQALIVKGAVDNARMIAREIIEARDYMASVVKNEPSENYNLVPQVVATHVAKRLTAGTPYYVRQVSLRYRNPDNRPDSFETTHLTRFKTQEAAETYDIVASEQGKQLRYLLPMRAEKACLECHGAYEKAPRFVQARFPKGHFSYNYNLGEVIGAVSVTVPMTSLYEDIRKNRNTDIFFRGGMFLVVMMLMGMLIRRTIITPITLVSRSISRAARTGSFNERLPVRRNDEVGELISAFNEMMAELERKIQQSRESEDRYRNFIKMAQSAVVTFMEDGKIVISNEKAEKLLGISRQDLLGENIFDFIEDGEVLQGRLTAFLEDGSEGVIGQTTIHRIKDVMGYYTQVELALSASRTSGSTMVTAILREVAPKK